MASIFTRIIQGDIPCHKIAETDEFIAFLDVSPLSPGHTLLVPKVEIDKFFDLPTETITAMMPLAHEIATAQARAIDCMRVGMSVFGLEVPHAHMHLIPIRSGADMDFSKVREKFSDEEYAEIARNIRGHLRAELL